MLSKGPSDKECGSCWGLLISCRGSLAVAEPAYTSIGIGGREQKVGFLGLGTIVGNPRFMLFPRGHTFPAGAGIWRVTHTGESHTSDIALCAINRTCRIVFSARDHLKSSNCKISAFSQHPVPPHISHAETVEKRNELLWLEHHETIEGSFPCFMFYIFGQR